MVVYYSVAWICSAAVAISGMMLTSSPWCILVMLLPALIMNSDTEK